MGNFWTCLRCWQQQASGHKAIGSRSLFPPLTWHTVEDRDDLVAQAMHGIFQYIPRRTWSNLRPVAQAPNFES